MVRTQSLVYKLGVRIRTLRKAAGLTQEQLAEIADISVNFMGYVERGQRAIDQNLGANRSGVKHPS